METATERTTVLMTPTEKKTLEANARQTGVSIGEYVRQSVAAYDPQQAEELAQLGVLAKELIAGNSHASAALDTALVEVAAMRRQLSRGRAV